jgi:hypothetical protein
MRSDYDRGEYLACVMTNGISRWRANACAKGFAEACGLSPGSQPPCAWWRASVSGVLLKQRVLADVARVRVDSNCVGRTFSEMPVSVAIVSVALHRGGTRGCAWLFGGVPVVFRGVGVFSDRFRDFPRVCFARGCLGLAARKTCVATRLCGARGVSGYWWYSRGMWWCRGNSPPVFLIFRACFSHAACWT